MTRQHISLALCEHRPEMLPFMAEGMRRHEAIFLEEPSDPEFTQMLSGSVNVSEYLMRHDVEYPDFSRGLCELLRDLKAQGKTIVQVEPYIEILLDIHDFFARGHRPEEISRQSARYPVYLAERNATGALLTYYHAAMTGTFETAIEALMEFARRDAARFRLRDSLRAQALARLVAKHPSSYIEAGTIHYPLWQMLRRRLPRPVRLRVSFLSTSALRTIGKKGHCYGPGDQLTLLYGFHGPLENSKREFLLAARSLIYSKLIAKQESREDPATMPHLRDELRCIEMVNRLSLNDCRRLFPRIRRAGTMQANRLVADYLTE